MEDLINETEEQKEEKVEIPKEIEINNIRHHKVNGEFQSLKVDYSIYHEGNFIQSGAWYIEEDLSYQGIKDFLYEKLKYKDIETFDNAIEYVDEVTEEIEIQEEGEF